MYVKVMREKCTWFLVRLPWRGRRSGRSGRSCGGSSHLPQEALPSQPVSCLLDQLAAQLMRPDTRGLRLVPVDASTLRVSGEPLAAERSLADSQLAEGALLGLQFAVADGWEELVITALPS